MFGPGTRCVIGDELYDLCFHDATSNLPKMFLKAYRLWLKGHPPQDIAARL